MGNVVLKMHLSVDGYVRGPEGDPMDWVFASFDDTLAAWEVELLWRAGVHVMGRTLYAEMAEHWPTSTEPYAPPMNQIPKLVFSRTLADAAWAENQIARGDAAGEIARLRASVSGDILVHGGPTMAQSLAAEDLIDLYHLIMHPVALGGGLRLFAAPANLRLMEARPFPGGAVVLTYARAGA